MIDLTILSRGVNPLPKSELSNFSVAYQIRTNKLTMVDIPIEPGILVHLSCMISSDFSSLLINDMYYITRVSNQEMVNHDYKKAIASLKIMNNTYYTKLLGGHASE